MGTTFSVKPNSHKTTSVDDDDDDDDDDVDRRTKIRESRRFFLPPMFLDSIIWELYLVWDFFIKKDIAQINHSFYLSQNYEPLEVTLFHNMGHS